MTSDHSNIPHIAVTTGLSSTRCALPRGSDKAAMAMRGCGYKPSFFSTLSPDSEQPPITPQSGDLQAFHARSPSNPAFLYPFNTPTFSFKPFSLISTLDPRLWSWPQGETSVEKTQQVDARGSTFNEVKRDQHNVQITINNNYTPSDKVIDNDPNIDPELNKYPPLVAYGLDIVASATTLITTNIAAVATHLGLPTLSDSVANTLKSLTVTKTIYRYSFFSKSDVLYTTICASCLQMVRL